jgi:hypothetical protein
MRPTIEKIKTSLTYRSSRTGGCFSASNEIRQFQWHNCLICGNYIHASITSPENIICKNIKHIRYNYDENLKEEIRNLIKIIEECDKCDDLLEHSTLNKKMLAVLSIELAEDQIMNSDDHNNLLHRFGIHDQVLS